jgi:hypothetical protein
MVLLLLPSISPATDLHDVQKVVVDLRVVAKLVLDLIKVRQSILNLPRERKKEKQKLRKCPRVFGCLKACA